jgi:hypothetical protein
VEHCPSLEQCRPGQRARLSLFETSPKVSPCLSALQERSRFEVFVCSKGKQEYVQLLWHMLDPLSQLFPTTDWDWRLNSTFPDTVPRAVQKTMLSALGCVHPLDDALHTQLACPAMCLDDCPNVSEGQQRDVGSGWLAEWERAKLCMLLWVFMEGFEVHKREVRRGRSFMLHTKESTPPVCLFCWVLDQSTEAGGARRCDLADMQPTCCTELPDMHEGLRPGDCAALLQAYREEYHSSVMYVEEYRPSDLFTADTGGCTCLRLVVMQEVGGGGLVHMSSICANGPAAALKCTDL